MTNRVLSAFTTGTASKEAMGRTTGLLLVIMMIWSVTAGAQSRGIDLQPVRKTASNPLEDGTYRALIIGNNDYRDPQKRWPSLRTAVQDAEAVSRLLQSNYGFSDVQVLANATRREVLHALNDLSGRVQANDSVLLYYAGHGFMDVDTERGYWVLADAVGTDHATFLRNSTIRDELNVIASRAKHTLLISDSCFSGSLLRRATRGATPATMTDSYIKKVAAKKSVQIISAGGLEYVDDNYRNSGHSPFTYFLVNELKHNDRILLTATELSKNVEQAVANNVDQKPESGVLQGAGDELGEFVFRLKVRVDAKGIPKDKIKVSVSVEPDKESGATPGKPAEKKTKQRDKSLHGKPLILPAPGI